MSSLKAKSSYAIVLLFVLMSLSSNMFACRLLGVISKNDTYGPANGGSYYLKLLSQLSSQSGSNPDGWGIAYYTRNSGTLTPMTGEIRQNNANNSTIFNQPRWAGWKPMNLNNDSGASGAATAVQNGQTRIALAHVRNSSYGTGIPDPHPWLYTTPDGLRTFSFIHNGTIAGSINANNSSYTSTCLEMKNEVQNYINDLIISGSSDQGLSSLIHYTQTVDSGIYFAYLIKHIRENNWDVLRGLSEALSGKSSSVSGTTAFNFVLTDGSDLYGYKDGSNDTYTLSYVNFDNYQSGSYRYNFAAIMSDFGSVTFEGITTTVFNSNKVALENKELVYIPRIGKPVSIKDFNQINGKRMSKSTNTLLTGQTSYYNWESFPIMSGIQDDAIRVITQNSANGTQYSGVGYTNADRLENSISNYANRINSIWDYTPYPFNIEPLNGYMLRSTGVNNARIEGTLCENGVIGDLIPGNIYWIGYPLANSQTLAQAFGSEFPKVSQVWAENWYFDRQVNDTKTTTNPTLVNASKPMEFGKMYKVKVSSNISNFKWNNSRIDSTPIVNPPSQNFVYQPAPEYEAIDIISVAKNPLPYKEIGIFDGETCLGATSVNQYPVQILAYTLGHEGNQLSFRALNENGVVSEINPVVTCYDRNSGEKSKKLLIAGDIEYAVMEIEEKNTNSSNELPVLVNEVKCYPNPFNPNTQITFTLTSSSEVNIEIFNIKGQLVKNLFKGNLPSGKHFVRWNGNDLNNHTLSSGVYFYKLKAGNNVITNKVMLLK